ncbi:hypothetical protein ACFL3Q_03930 [Planctomycetota bacterium]
MDRKIKIFIDSANWIFAKTYAKTAPHEYAVRGDAPDLEDNFIYFVNFISMHGYEERFWSKVHTYYNIGEYKYWTMGNPIDETTIINRAVINSSSEENQ